MVTPENILRIGFDYWNSRTLLSAVELGVFNELAVAPANLATLQARLNLHPRGTRDFLDALVAMKFLDREDGVYRNAPDTDMFLDKAKPSYLGGLLELAAGPLYQNWNGLNDALRTGRAQNESRDGDNVFVKIYETPEGVRDFLRAMTGISMGPAQAVAAKFDWARYKTFADVGTAEGALPVALAQAHPHLEGVGFDLSLVRPIFEEYIERNGVGDRVRFEGGNFFEGPMPSADVLVLGHVLHDWDLEQKKLLLAKAFAALPKGGVLIVYEAMIDDDRRENAFGLLMSLNMLLGTSGGFDYTGADCQEWMREAGFASTRLESLGGPHAMVIGIKPD